MLYRTVLKYSNVPLCPETGFGDFRLNPLPHGIFFSSTTQPVGQMNQGAFIQEMNWNMKRKGWGDFLEWFGSLNIADPTREKHYVLPSPSLWV